jgi:hypothetical protein
LLGGPEKVGVWRFDPVSGHHLESTPNEIALTPAPPTVAHLTVDKFQGCARRSQKPWPAAHQLRSKKGTVILSGSVHTVHERVEAVELAKAVPHVERVVDEIKVERQRD